jgi:hypothetical protein
MAPTLVPEDLPLYINAISLSGNLKVIGDKPLHLRDGHSELNFNQNIFLLMVSTDHLLESTPFLYGALNGVNQTILEKSKYIKKCCLSAPVRADYDA